MRESFNLILFLGIFLFFLNSGIAQSFQTQVLNKGSFESVASLTQDYDGDGDLDIILTRWGPAGIYWLENDDTKQFPAHPIITEDLTFYMADIDAADFDNDGDMDYVVCFSDVNDGEIAWFQRQDDGTYIKWTIATNKDFIEADVADFNGDGWMDIVAVGLGNSDETGRVYINQQNLFFEERIVAQDVTEAVDAEDIDGDGDVDIAFGGSGLINNPNVVDGGARIIINDGNGNFNVRDWLITFTNSHAAIGEKISIVDLNGDGVKDVLGFGSSGTNALLFFDGTRGYQREIINEEGIDCGGDLVVFDIDDDGDLDIVRQEWCDKNLIVLYQEAGFQFRRELLDINWDNGANPTAKMSVADLDNDGDLDLFFPEKGNVDLDISWYENIDGKLYRHQLYGDLRGARIPKFGDIDNDGDMDILLTVAENVSHENELLYFENIGNQQFINWRLHDNLDYAADVELADIDGDGDLDAFATARDADDLVWLRNDGFPANWVTDTIDAEANQPLGIIAGDIDLDGDVDVALCSSNDAKVFWYENNGSGNFSKRVIDATLENPREIEMGDIDNDGDMDFVVAVAQDDDGLVTIHRNNGNFSFTREVIYTGTSVRDIELGDWNDDGMLDIIAGLYSGSTFADGVDVIGIINRGGNTFETIDLVTLKQRTNALKLTDLDNDNDLDIVFAQNADRRDVSAVQAIINENGTVKEIVAIADYSNGTVLGIDVADVDGDNIKEIVFADISRNSDLVLASNLCFGKVALDLGRDTTLTTNEPFTIVPSTIGNNLSFTWSTDEMTNSLSVIESGTFGLTITDENGCETSDEIEITFEIVSSTKSVIPSERIQVSPNPVRDYLRVEFAEGISLPVEVRLMDVLGRVHYRNSVFTNAPLQVGMQEVGKGRYLLVVENAEGIGARKILIK